ncbi:putative A-kinase anchor protein 14 [Scophthalmus maximus]|uniref:Putative A-kinase anchor protein 14 n=1 Tax=Scophthalmus maximus TaxID=52904 RepID=A0A2U9B226_SCOMX|nr:A-kinase anchor protein 14 [Scophthalmus maximus]AWO97992.1 putative A-kinase anchor protein 14 [Scophthalmus maximus]KAF0029654.1 hypothetical protein F2P81_018759 [Scophthalmus maximus]
MEEHDVNFTAESAQLVKALLERDRQTTAEDEQEGKLPASVSWVASGDFTVEVGKRQLGEYIRTWEVQPCWLHSLDFLCTTEQERRTFHHYRARFSTPTPRRPIRGTASVYFAMHASSVQPRALPMEVHFVLESNRLLHAPATTRFREKWLADVVESKTLLRNEVQL